MSRVWLRDEVIFVPSPGDGTDEKLTDEGKTRLDDALAPFLARLTHTIIVIEGYSQHGSEAERHVASRARASLVRDYPIDRFHVDEAAIGLMPLGGAGRWEPSRLHVEWRCARRVRRTLTEAWKPGVE